MNPEAVDFEAVCKVVAEAGAAIMAIYAGSHDVEYKADRSPLTAADRAAHAVIVDGLQRVAPNLPILSEEGGEIPSSVRRKWSRFWLVDPLDGTKEFIKRNGEFTVNVALIDNGLPVFGVVGVPALSTLYMGGVGIGAWVRHGEADPRAIHVRTADSSLGLTVVMSRSHPSQELDEFLKNFKVAEALPVGSSLKLCAVAEGRADLYPRLGPTMEWDTSAGQAIVEAAGGRVVTLDGEPLRYNKESLLNPHFVVYGSLIRADMARMFRI